MNAPKATITHNQNMIASPRLSGNGLNQFFHIIVRLSFRAQRGECGGGVPTEIRAVAKHVIRRAKTMR